MAFTQEQKQLCVDMAMEGYTVAAIRDATGFTLGQVVGFARRAGITIRKIRKFKKVKELPPVPVLVIEHKPRVPIEPVQIRKKHAPPKEPVETRVGSDTPVTILELTRDHCRWMLDDTHYCGAITIIKNGRLQSYCKGHYRIMYRPLPNVQNKKR